MKKNLSSVIWVVILVVFVGIILATFVIVRRDNLIAPVMVESKREFQPSKEKSLPQESPKLKQDAGGEKQVKETTLKKVNEEERYAYYEGKIVVSGKYFEYHPNTMMGGTLCFRVDDKTGYLIPRDSNIHGPGFGDTRDPWFCFNDQTKVKTLFGIDDDAFSQTTMKDPCLVGDATVEVSHYVVDKRESEVFDTATLERITSKGTYSIQEACQLFE